MTLLDRRLAIDAVVLAAGEGSRLGRPKAHLVLEGEPLVARHAARARDAGCARVVLVARPDDVAWLGGFADIVVSGAAQPADSLRAGLAALAARPPDAVLITPVDSLPPRIETTATLLGALARGARAASPRHAGKGGHPVLVRWDALGAFRAGEHATLRDLLSSLGAARVRVDVDDPAIATDLDTAADVRAATGHEPVFVARPG